MQERSDWVRRENRSRMKCSVRAGAVSWREEKWRSQAVEVEGASGVEWGGCFVALPGPGGAGGNVSWATLRNGQHSIAAPNGIALLTHPWRNALVLRPTVVLWAAAEHSKERCPCMMVGPMVHTQAACMGSSSAFPFSWRAWCREGLGRWRGTWQPVSLHCNLCSRVRCTLFTDSAWLRRQQKVHCKGNSSCMTEMGISKGSLLAWAACQYSWFRE